MLHSLRTGWLVILLLTLCVACRRDEPADAPAAPDVVAEAEDDDPLPTPGADYGTEPADLPSFEPADDPRQRPQRTSMADLMDEQVSTDPLDMTREQQLGQVIDEKRVAAAGIRKLQGRHLTLYTDLPSQEAVDELPQAFDQAVPQWTAYFGVDPARSAKLHLTGYLMQAKEKFQAVDLLPADLPPFLHGYQRGFEFWLYDQPSDYYRRHLVLHEGTHGFMHLLLGGIGPPWYAEGTAELCGTHRWADGKLTLRYFPQSRDDTPQWGRIKIVRDDFATGRGMMLREVFNYGPRAHLNVEPYGWCWAAAAFLDAHPAYRDRFRAMTAHSRDFSFGFSQKLIDAYEGDWDQINEQWQLLVYHMDYGYDVERAAVEYKPVEALPAGGATIEVSADRGWQSTGYRLEADRQYRVVARGRYQVAQQPRPWDCEPEGVTIHYHRGRPLGLLLGAVRDESQPLEGITPLVAPVPIGKSCTLAPQASGTLFLSINESAAALADNTGHVTVRIVGR